MNAKTAIQIALETAKTITDAYLGDLTDAEMLHRPGVGCNHIKWQLGHLITSEHQMMDSCFPGKMPPLPVGFAARYAQENSKFDQPDFFDSKQMLLELHEQQRNGTMQLLHQTSDTDLDRLAPESIRSYAPNVGAAFLMQDVHWTMHAGQWAIIRRQLGRPALF
jgi:hypothetical protein